MFLRVAIRLILVVAAILAIAAIVVSLLPISLGSPEIWAVVAAALAVITSVVSSWPAQRVLELGQDAQKPYPHPAIDVKSRYMLMQLRVTNFGGSVAYDIRFKWHKPLLDANGELVRFTNQEGGAEIPVLMPKESVAVLIGANHTLFEKYKDMDYSGEIEFSDASGKRMKHRFYLSAEAFRNTLVYDEEGSRTHYEIQKIPDELRKLRGEVRQLRMTLLQFPEATGDSGDESFGNSGTA